MQSNQVPQRPWLPWVLLVLGMLALSYASVPFYRIFCQKTGFGGTPTEVVLSPDRVGTRKLQVAFDANTMQGLSWSFAPQQKVLTVTPGIRSLAFYEATNRGDVGQYGMATYNVTPHEAGKYFHKIHCFCFESQYLAGGERAVFPVSFLIDAAFEDDPRMRHIDRITLSYSFFPLPADSIVDIQSVESSQGVAEPQSDPTRRSTTKGISSRVTFRIAPSTNLASGITRSSATSNNNSS
jgi:cytochrome c oxidase assembly protein subunit 11